MQRTGSHQDQRQFIDPKTSEWVLANNVKALTFSSNANGKQQYEAEKRTVKRTDNAVNQTQLLESNTGN